MSVGSFPAISEEHYEYSGSIVQCINNFENNLKEPHLIGVGDYVKCHVAATSSTFAPPPR